MRRSSRRLYRRSPLRRALASSARHSTVAIASSTNCRARLRRGELVVVTEGPHELGLVAQRVAEHAARSEDAAGALRPRRASRGRRSPGWRRGPGPRRAGGAAAARGPGRARPEHHSSSSGRSCSSSRDVRLKPRVSSSSAARVARGRGSRRPAAAPRPRPASSGPGRPARASSSGPKKSFSCVERTRAWCARWSASSCSTADRSAAVAVAEHPREPGAAPRGRSGACASAARPRAAAGARRCAGTGRRRRTAPASRRIDVARADELAQRLQRVRGTDRRVVATVHELQQLDRELDVADPAAPRFSSRSSSPRPMRLAFGARLHRPHRPHRVRAEHVRPHERLDELGEARAQLGVAGDRPRLDERLELPGLRPPLVPGRVRLEAAGERPGPALGPQVGVGAEDDPGRRRLGHHRQEPPGRVVGVAVGSPSWTNSTSTSLA